MSRRVWKAVETEVEKARMVEAKRGREEIRRKRIEKIEKGKENRSEESSKRVGDLEQIKGSS